VLGASSLTPVRWPRPPAVAAVHNLSLSNDGFVVPDLPAGLVTLRARLRVPTVTCTATNDSEQATVQFIGQSSFNHAFAARSSANAPTARQPIGQTTPSTAWG
jgi:hypothetical protein